MNYLLLFWVILVQTLWQGDHTKTETLKPDSSTIQDYWKQIDSLEARGLIVDAHRLLDQYMVLIQADTQPFEWVKSRIYKARFLDFAEDQPELKGIRYLETALLEAGGPALPVMQSLLGSFYMNYSFSAQSTDAEISTDRTDSLEYWTPTQCIRRANELYLLSVKDAEKWSAFPLSAMESIVQFQEKNETVLNNLFELLIHRALNHFYHSNAMLVEPAYAFQPNDPLFFSPSDEFINAVWQTQDTNALLHKALKLHQKTIPAIKDNIPLSVQWDLRRFAAIHNTSGLEEKDQLHRKALNHLLNKWKSHLVYVYIACELAGIDLRLGDEYVAGEEETEPLRWKKKEALQLLQGAVEAFPQAPHAAEARSIISRILAPDYALQTSSNLLPNKDIPLLISYKNSNRVAYHIFAISPEQWLNLENQRSRQIRELIRSLPLIRKDAFDLQDLEDYQWHSTEVVFKGLNPGLYLIVSEDELSSEESNNIRYNLIQSTSLSLVQQDGEIWIADKTNACPVPKAQVSVYQRVYKNRSSYNELQRQGNTDSNGYYHALPSGDYASLIIQHAGQTLISQATNRNWFRGDEPQERILLFTDRSVYRPGQIVYFKGILLNYENERPKNLIPNQRVRLILNDVNAQEISTLELTSNALGSFDGSFVLPATGLTGGFHIRDNNYRGSVYFSVEEYKRPRFEVKLNEPSGTYTLGDNVLIKGQANMFAGTPVSGAEVRYTVSRTSFFPWRTGRISFPYRSNKVITQGTATTKEDGSFDISFQAQPDLAIRSDWSPVYQYNILAEVIDISGETRIGNLSVRVSKSRFLPSLQVPEKIVIPERASINFDLTNLAGQTQNIPVNIKVIALQSNQKLWIPRTWKMPDIRSIDEKAWRGLFPDRPYKNEHDPESWPEGKVWLQKSLNPAVSKELALPESLPAGLYRIQMEVKDGNEVLNTSALLQVFEAKRKEIPMPTRPIEIFVAKNSYQPGEKALIQIRALDKKACLYLAVEKQGKIVREGWQEVNGLLNLELPVKEEDRGGFFLHAIYHWQEGPTIINIPIAVPFKDKDLNIEWISSRNRIQPGMDETWQIKINDHKNQPAKAELMSVLYDASLDRIVAPAWWPGITHPDNSSKISFSQVFSRGLIINRRAAPWVSTQGKVWYSPDFSIQVHQAFFPYYGGVRRSKSGMEMETSIEMKVPMMVSDAEPPLLTAPKIDAHIKDPLEGLQINSGVTESIVPRRSLKETVFFYPSQTTDMNGNVTLEFKMEEALTRWKLRLYAHDQQLAYGYKEYEVETFKELMVFPNVPRFVRQNDTIGLSFKAQNQSAKDQDITFHIQLRDALSGENLNSWLLEKRSSKSALLANGMAETWAPKVAIPNDFSGILEITYLVKGENHTDAEVHHLPVLSNRQLVTETLPIWVNPNEKLSFSLSNIGNQMKSNSLKPHSLSLEFSPNPAWYALQAMPYIMDQDNASTDFKVNRLYANVLGTSLMAKYPQVKAFFNAWQQDPGAVRNPLFENEALKSALLRETPWVLEAKSEKEQKQRLALLFDVNRMATEEKASIQSLQAAQNPDGGFPWFPGGKSNWYTTQYVIEKLGHLEQLNAKNVRASKELRQILQDAIRYIDAQALDHLERRVPANSSKPTKMELAHLNAMIIHYLYVRSFFGEVPQSMILRQYSGELFDLLEGNFMNFGLQEQAMASLALWRNLRKTGAQLILRSMIQRSVYNEEMGRFWKSNAGWYWHQRPIESHTAVMEALQEIAADEKTWAELSRWLLKQKQTNSWPGNSATSRAIYVLLSSNAEWLTESITPQITINEKTLSLDGTKQESGTGYFHKQLELPNREATSWDIELVNQAGTPGWGGIYWQSFEDLDKIQTFQETPLRMTKNIFLKKQTQSGSQVQPIIDGSELQIGDLLSVRIEFRVDRAMEFVHLKDMRAAAFEPIEVRSGYIWSNRLFYYQSIRDLSVDFFFESLSPGTYVLEYDLRVFHAGSFSNGISTMQSVYAPEFSTHTGGYRIKVKS